MDLSINYFQLELLTGILSHLSLGGFPTFQGIVICILCGFIATNVSPVRKEEDIERVLKVGREDEVGLDVWEVLEPSGHAMVMVCGL